MKRINTDVSLASQTHHVPHIGFPHSDPVTKAKKVKVAPMGAVDLAIENAIGCFQIKAEPHESAIIK